MKAVYFTSNSSFNTQYRSDTLWGLIISALSILKPKSEIDGLIQSYLDNKPPFIISSLLPYSRNYKDELIHFFPKPIVRNFDYGVHNALMMSYFKDFRKLNYVTQNLFEDIITGSCSGKHLYEKFVELKTFEKRELRIYFSKPLIKLEQVLHNTIDRMSCSTLETEEGGQLFTTNDYYLYKNYRNDSEVEDKELEIKESSLFFLIEGDVSIIEPALRFLSHFGFGGNNTTGKGNFNYEIKDFSLKTPDSPNSFVTLSLFHPTTDQRTEITKKENKNKLWYEIDFRAGRIGVHFADEPNKNQKNIVANFVEGSTFPYLENKYLGKLIKTASTELHLVYNNGFCFKIPSNLKYE